MHEDARRAEFQSAVFNANRQAALGHAEFVEYSAVMLLSALNHSDNRRRDLDRLFAAFELIEMCPGRIPGRVLEDAADIIRGNTTFRKASARLKSSAGWKEYPGRKDDPHGSFGEHLAEPSEAPRRKAKAT
jgi:hypothetical protein